MENYGLVSAGGDRGGEKELDSRRILVVRTDWTLCWFGYEV